MSKREEWPSAKEAARMLVRQRDHVVKRELPGAIKKRGYWHAGSVAGEAGTSLFVGTDGKWKDSNPASDDHGDLIDLIAKARGVSLSKAYEAACVEYLGYEKIGDGEQGGRPKPRLPAPPPAPRVEETPRSLEFARRIWRETVSAIGTPVERYLRDVRCVTCKLPSVLRYHPKCPRGDGGERLPAMVALYTDIRTNEPRSIHRTFLRPDGAGKDAGEFGDDDKMALGPNGGCCIRLTPDADVIANLGICEGIETGLSLLSIGYGAIWAAGTAGTIKAFPVLTSIEVLDIFADNDASGAGSVAAQACAERWLAAGREVRIILPNEVDTDWNDIVRAA